MRLIAHIILICTVPLTLIFLAMCTLTLSIVIPSIIIWGNKLENHIIREEINNLIIRTNNIRNLTSLNFGQIANEIDLMKTYTNKMYNNTFNIKSYYPNYYITGEHPRVINGINNKHSVWYNKNSALPQDQSHLNISSILDNVWRSLFWSNTKYQGLYIGYEDGLFRHFPYMVLSHYPSYAYTCLSNNQHTVGYDPRCRGWYIAAKEDQTKIHFTEPYSDAGTGDILISAAHAVHDNNIFIGAVSIDISMGDLASVILTETILDNGYTYLLDTRDNIIVYPNLEYDQLYSVFDLEFTSQTERTAFQQIFTDMKESTIGSQNFIKNGNDWLIIYGKVEGTDYIISMVVPYSDIKKSVTIINVLVGVCIGISVLIMIITTILMIIISVYTNVIISKKITDPLKQFTNVTTSITQDHLDIELGDINAGAPEISSIYKNFQYLIKAVRFANEKYAENNLALAYKNYLEVEKMLLKLENKKGLGVVYNNIGIVLKDLKEISNHLSMAKEYFDKAIANATELQDSAIKKQDNCTVTFFAITLANRYMNLGIYYTELSETTKAMKMFDTSIHIHKHTDNKLGEIKTMGNMGNLLMNIGKLEDAFSIYSEAYQVAFDRYTKNKIEQNAELLQYASFNMGLYYKRTENYNKARRYLDQAISVKKRIQTNFKNACLFNLSEVHTLLGNTTLSKELISTLTKPKHIIFVLDCSGSMDGSPIQQCRKSITTIIRNYLTCGDTVSLMIFSNEVRWVFQKTLMEGNQDNMIYKTKHNTQIGGRTAFYDAVYTSIRSSIKDDNTWIVALTDGEDNASTHTYQNVADDVRRYNVNIVLITVGKLKTIRYLKYITDSSRSGMLIQTTDIQGIREAFSQAIDVINRGQVNIETF